MRRPELPRHARQLELFRPDSPKLEWRQLPAEVRGKATRLMARMLQERQNLVARLDRPAETTRPAFELDAARIEPVSTGKFLLTGKRTGNSAESGHPLRFRRPIGERIQLPWR
jgi:hypothetical protein